MLAATAWVSLDGCSTQLRGDQTPKFRSAWREIAARVIERCSVDPLLQIAILLVGCRRYDRISAMAEGSQAVMATGSCTGWMCLASVERQDDGWAMATISSLRMRMVANSIPTLRSSSPVLQSSEMPTTVQQPWVETARVAASNLKV